MNLENSELFAKIFLDIIHGYTENVFGTVTYLPIFSLPYLLPVHQNFPCQNSPVYSTCTCT